MKPAPSEPDGRYGWAIQLMCLLTVLTYFIAGQTKLRNAGFDWVTTDSLRNFIAYDNLRKAELGDSYSFIGAALVAHGWLFKPLAAFTLAVELGAPLAMLGGRIAKLWALSAMAIPRRRPCRHGDLVSLPARWGRLCTVLSSRAALAPGYATEAIMGCQDVIRIWRVGSASQAVWGLDRQPAPAGVSN